MKSSSNFSEEDFISVGYIRAAHGIRGEVFAVIPSLQWEWAEASPDIYLVPRHTLENPQVFHIEKYKPHKNGLILKLKEVPDRNRAEELKGTRVFVSKEYFVSPPGEKVFLNEVLDFQVFNVEELVGQVVGFMDNGAQDLLRVRDIKDSDKEHLVPFLEVFIDQIDFETQEIHMTLPEGLLE